MTLSQELPSLTPLRGIAALVVLGYHLRAIACSEAPAEMPVLIGHGYLAVDLFFMLSGFVLMHVYGARFAERIAWADLRPFLWARFARLYPVHLLLLLILLPLYDNGVFEYSGAHLVASLLLLQGPWIDGMVWNAAAWSISIECHAYLLFPFVAWFIWRFSGRPVAAMMVLCIFGALAAVAGADGDLSINFGPLCLVRGLSEFVAGVLLYRCRREGWLGLWRHDYIFATSLAAVVISASFRGTDVLTVMCLGSLLAATTMNSDKIATALNTKLPSFLGRISYSLYMVHTIALTALAHGIISLTGGTTAPPFFTVIALIAALGFGALVSRCVEYPARDFLRSIASRRPQAATAGEISSGAISN